MFKKLMILITLSSFCSGCTWSLINAVEKGTKYKAEETTFETAGSYLGTVIVNNEKYWQYSFATSDLLISSNCKYIWPNVHEMIILLGYGNISLINICPKKKDFHLEKVNKTKSFDSILYVHTFKEVDLKKVQYDVQKHIKDGNRSLAKYKNNPTIICLYMKKDIEGSEVILGEESDGEYLWSSPFIVTEQITDYEAGKWWSPAKRINYVFLPVTVAADVALSPLYLSAYIFAYIAFGDMNKHW